jgi:hypothetical protein
MGLKVIATDALFILDFLFQNNISCSFRQVLELTRVVVRYFVVSYGLSRAQLIEEHPITQII